MATAAMAAKEQRWQGSGSNNGRNCSDSGDGCGSDGGSNDDSGRNGSDSSNGNIVRDAVSQ